MKKSKNFRGYRMKKRMGALVSIVVIVLAGCGLMENNTISNKEQISLEQEKSEKTKENNEKNVDNIKEETTEKEEEVKNTPEPTKEEEEYECGLIEEYITAPKEELEITVTPAEEKEVYEDLSSLPKEIQNILYENGSFYEVYNQKEYTRLTYDATHYKTTEPMELAEWGHYIVLDFDRDGEKELAVMMQESHSICFVEVFDLQEGKVYACENSYRGFLDICTDGALFGSSGASDNMLYRLGFDGNRMKTEVIAGQKGSVWYILDKEVAEEELDDFVNSRYGEGTSVSWSSSTLDEILP